MPISLSLPLLLRTHYRTGLIPRIVRRLSDPERKSMIKSGAIFVFSVEESGVKRWTDGLTWSPSRIMGNFLVRSTSNTTTSVNDFAHL